MFLAFFFLIVGIAMFITGCFSNVREWDPFGGFLFWGSGLILAVPGFYFTKKVIDAYRTNDLNVRNNLLREIPDM